MSAEASSKMLITANNDFTVSLYQALFPSNSKDNLIFSPFSLHAVLGMVAQGARGNTRTEILEGLEFQEKNDEVILKSYNSVITGFQKRASPGTYTLLTANRVYSQIGYLVNPAFVNTLKTYFQSDFIQLEISNPEACQVAADKINMWVAATTNNKIKDVIKADCLNAETRLVLVNCIYFKGFWRHQFRPSNTSKEPFHVTPNEKVSIDMMHNEEYYPYAKIPELKAEAVSLLYRGGRLSMVIILPNDVNGLDTVQNNIETILKGGKSIVKDSFITTQMIQLSLPKFKVETTLRNINDVLVDNLGFSTMFNPKEADFSGIPSAEILSKPFISKLIQKAFIEVNEEGAEAVAATATIVTDGPVRKPSFIPFVVNRPFYFQIVDHANGELVLFSGHVNNPSL